MELAEGHAATEWEKREGRWKLWPIRLPDPSCPTMSRQTVERQRDVGVHEGIRAELGEVPGGGGT